MTPSPTLGIDIGGTKLSAALVYPDGTLSHRMLRDTPHHPWSAAAVETSIIEVATELMAVEPVSAVGVGAAGWVCRQRQRVLFAPHLAWRGEPLQERLTTRLGLPVVVDNDANTAAWAEWRFGAGRGESHLVMITVGTGIGGALVIDGRLERGRYGLAGEFGHLQVVPDGRPCACGSRGCWEQYASGDALVRQARELMNAGSAAVRALAQSVGGDAGGLTGPLITRAAQDGDQAAVDLLVEAGRWLGAGLASITAALDPGGFVIGGGVSEAGELLLGPARESFARLLPGRGYRPEPFIRPAQHGNDAGVIGAGDLARVD